MQKRVVLAIIRPGERRTSELSRETVKEIFSKFGGVKAAELIPCSGFLEALIEFTTPEGCAHCLEVAERLLAPAFKVKTYLSKKAFVVENIAQKNPKKKKSTDESNGRAEEGGPGAFSPNVSGASEPAPPQTHSQPRSSFDNTGAFLATSFMSEKEEALFETFPGGKKLIAQADLDSLEKFSKSKMSSTDATMSGRMSCISNGLCDPRGANPGPFKSSKCIEKERSFGAPNAPKTHLWFYDFNERIVRKRYLLNICRLFGVVEELIVLHLHQKVIVRFSSAADTARAHKALDGLKIFGQVLKTNLIDEVSTRLVLPKPSQGCPVKKWHVTDDGRLAAPLFGRFINQPSTTLLVGDFSDTLTPPLMETLLRDLIGPRWEEVALLPSLTERTFRINFLTVSEAVEALARLDRLKVNNGKLRATLLDRAVTGSPKERPDSSLGELPPKTRQQKLAC